MSADRDTRDAAARHFGAGGSEAGRPTILQVLPQMGAGDVERHCLDVVGALSRAGWGVVVASAGGPFVHEVTRAGGVHVSVPLDNDGVLAIRRNARRLGEVIRERGVTLVHAHERAAAWSGYHAAYRAEIPFVTSFPGPYPPARRRQHRYNAIMAQGARVIAASRPIGEHVVETYGIDAGRIRIIPPGIDIFSFDPRRVSAERLMRLSAAWRLPDGQSVVLIPGPIDYGRGLGARGLGVVLDAISRLARRDVVCLLGEAGTRSPEDVAVLNRLVERHALAGIVRSAPEIKPELRPELKDVPAALMLADVVITVATAPEACGRVLAEAQTMGRPVIAADGFGAAEFMLEDETGWIVQPDDPARLADVLGFVLGLSAEERGALAERAMPHARDRFSRERLGEAVLAVYADVLAEAPAAT